MTYLCIQRILFRKYFGPRLVDFHQNVASHRSSFAGRHAWILEEDPHVIPLGLAALDIGGDLVVLSLPDELNRRKQIKGVEIHGQGPGLVANEQIHAVGPVALDMSQKNLVGHWLFDLVDAAVMGIEGAVRVRQAGEARAEQRDLLRDRSCAWGCLHNGTSAHDLLKGRAEAGTGAGLDRLAILSL